MVPRPLPRCASQVLGRDDQTDARGAAQVFVRGVQANARVAAQVLDCDAQAAARGAARCAPQVLDCGAQAVARGAARCASKVFYRHAQAVARGAAALSKQVKENSPDIQRNRVNTPGFIFTEANLPSWRCTFDDFEEKNNSADVQRGGFILRGDVPSASSGRWPIALRRARPRQSMLEP